MKQKTIFLSAIAALALVGCSSDDVVNGSAEVGQNGENAISFNLQTPAMSRAAETGSTAATTLGKRFIVWGEKNEADGTAAAAKNQVFNNYVVNYTASTAYTTTSNTKDWEYVGQTSYTSNVTPNIGSSASQTIKYWDYSASSYTFTAISALDADITDGNVVIAKTTSGDDVYAKGYTVTVKSGASVNNIYFSDRLNIAQGTGTDRTATNAYGGNATLNFRNFMSKIRFAVYETIPGYSVKIDKVYYNSTNSTSNFGVDGSFIIAGDNTKFTVTYENSESANENKAKVAVDGSSAKQTYFETASSTINSATALGTASNAATYDKTGGAYTTILPNPSNATNLKLKVDYTLKSEDTGEEIKVTGATAEVPSQYCQWKSNYAYTYIFKISDNTNGSTGGSVVGLYPITFDATVVTDENGTQETITTVSEPSITTFGVSGGKYVASSAPEYAAGTDVYATIVEGSSVVAPTLGTNVNIYSVTAGMTEAQVAEAIYAGQTSKYNLNNSLGTVVTSVPTEDGKTIDQKAVKMAALTAGTYAVEYTASKAWSGSYTKVYKVIVVK